jgi:biotin-(acetyl-CoA carboxylase) ligase
VSEIREYKVGMSVEALAAAWARQENADHGSVIVVANEISGRMRGGVPWTVGEPDGLMMGMITRPKIVPTQEALLWLATSLGTVQAMDQVLERTHEIVWPDTICTNDGEELCSMNVDVQLGPGRIEHAILVLRANLAVLGADRARISAANLVEALTLNLSSAVAQLEVDPLTTIDQFTERCSIIDQRVNITLLPRGQARGQVAAVDADGFLVLKSNTGMLERIAPASLRRIDML